MGLIEKALHANKKPDDAKKHHALHELKDFVFSPLGLAFTIGLILAVHWFSTRETAKK